MMSLKLWLNSSKFNPKNILIAILRGNIRCVDTPPITNRLIGAKRWVVPNFIYKYDPPRFVWRNYSNLWTLKISKNFLFRNYEFSVFSEFSCQTLVRWFLYWLDLNVLNPNVMRKNALPIIYAAVRGFHSKSE